MSSEPKTPTLTPFKGGKSSNRSTPNKSHNSISNPKSSKWAKFQEKFHSYSSKSSTTPTSTSTISHPHIPQWPQYPQSSANSSTSFTQSPHHVPYTASFSDHSFENPQDYLRNLSLDENSISPIFGINKSTPVSLNSNSNLTLPSRTSSLPKSSEALLTDSCQRSASNLTLNNDSTLVSSSQQPPSTPQVHQTPPKVKPFIYSKVSTPPRSKKTLINEKCCFCEELLSSKFSTGEKIIALTCGDTCHEECLWTFIDENDDELQNVKTSDPKKIFPNCESCGKLAIPLDESITDSIVSKILLASTPPKHNQLHAHDDAMTTSSSSDSLIISSNYKSQLLGSPSKSILQPPSSAKSHKYQSLSLSSSRNQKDLSIQIPLTSTTGSRHYSKPNHLHSLPHNKSASRGSSISAMSSIISSVSRSPSPNHNDTFMSLNINNDKEKDKSNKIPLAMLRSEYISHLIKKLNQFYPRGIKESEVDSFGLLRLVDNMLVSSNGETFQNYIVYLFQYNLLLVEENFTHVEIYQLLKNPQISTPTSSILKISLNNGSKSLYFSQKSNKILQKWIAGLCDYEFIFNSDNLSSTIHIPVSASPINDQSQWKPVAPQSLDASLDRKPSMKGGKDEMTIPVLLSPIKFDDLNTPIVESPTETFFKKTDNLIIIIDHEKPLVQSTKITLQNILKAMNFKFNQLLCICSTEQFGNIYKFGELDQVISSIGSPSDDSMKTKVTINQLITQLSNQNFEKYSLLVISNNLTKQSIKQLPLANQLLVQIQNYNSAKLTQRDNLVRLDSWDKIMETLVNKYAISFDDDSDISDIDEDSDFDSDFDSDIDGENQSVSQSDNEHTQGEQTIETDKHESMNLQDTDLDTSDEEDYDYDSDIDATVPQIQIQINDQEEIPSLHSNDEQSSNYDSKSEISPITENDDEKHQSFDSMNSTTSTILNTNQAHAIGHENKPRWSTLLKDIDDALLETMETTDPVSSD